MYSFMKKCRAASTKDEKAKHYINILLSSVEYETFVKLMLIMKPVAAMRNSIAKTASSEADAKVEGKFTSPSKASAKSSVAGADEVAGSKVSVDMPSVAADAKIVGGAPADTKGGSK
jgi:hypothetical protein